jgi:hypothetical protein
MAVWLTLAWVGSTLLILWITNRCANKRPRPKDWDGEPYWP